MRLFVAIDINDSVREKLCQLQENISQQCRFGKFDVKWVLPEQIHLTLKFLGQVKDDELAEVCNIVKSIADEKTGFELGFERLGHLGGKSPSVIWVATGLGSDKLQDLQKDLENKFVSSGFASDNKAFSGHLTLCRVKNPKAGYKLKKACDTYKDFKAGSVVVDSATVYCSRLNSQGPVYSVVGRYKLQ